MKGNERKNCGFDRGVRKIINGNKKKKQKYKNHKKKRAKN